MIQLPKKKPAATATISKSVYNLSDIIEITSPAQMEIFKDGPVERDAFGNLLINIGYIRVSTDKQADEGYGLDVQRDRIKDYINNSENKVSNLLLFIDAGITGTTMNRPAINMITRMIEQFNSGLTKIRVQKMIIPRIDRLSRSLLGTLKFIQDYLVCANDAKDSYINRNKEDIEFISCDEKFCRIEKDNPHGKLLLIMFGGLAEFDRDMIVKKMRDGKNKRIMSGKWFGGGNKPYGYRYDKEMGKLVIVPEEADKVREIFRLFIEEDLSPQKIADRLGFKSDTVIRAILKRKSLTGCINATIDGEEVEIPNAHKEIVSLERWNQAQAKFDERKSDKGESNNLLKGLCVCGECGAGMRYHKWSGTHSKIVCYSQCAGKHQQYLVKDPNCPNEKYYAEDIENAVVEELFKMSYRCDEEKVAETALFSPLEKLEQEKAECFKELDIVIARLSKMPIGSPSATRYEEKEQELNNKIMRLEKQILREQKEKAITQKVDKARETFRTLQSAYPDMTPSEKQRTIKELVEKVIIKKNGTLDVNIRLEKYLINNDITV